MVIRPRRSVLYVPATNARALEKLPGLPCDAAIIDLEDAVAPEQKAAARAALSALPRFPRDLAVRVNAPGTGWHDADLDAAVAARPHAVLVPKADSAAMLAAVRGAIDARGGEAIRLWAMIETPAAVLALGQLSAFAADPSSRMDCFVVGTNDLAKEMRLREPGRRAALRPLLVLAVAAARAAGADIVDGVFNAHADAAGLAAECAEGAALGFDGKSLIHPAQIGPANAAFSPTAGEIAAARAIVDAFARPENAGRGVIALDGRMVERLHLAEAGRTLALAALVPPTE